MGFPGGTAVKNPPTVSETQEIWVQSLGWEDTPVGRIGNPLQYSCLENPMYRGAWRTTVDGVPKSLTQLSDRHFHFHKKVAGKSVFP